MESKYTATLYANDQIVDSHNGNDLGHLIASLLVHLNECMSGSYGTIKDNAEDKIVQRYRKSVID